jgi:hypothetical protein
MKSELVLYCDQAAILSGLPCNDGIDKVLGRIEELRSQGLDVQVVDTSKMSEQEIQANYFRAIQPSVRKKYSVRQVFGSLSRPAWLFARGVPALVVQEPSCEAVADVFPHKESGRIVTIQDALNRANLSA